MANALPSYRLSPRAIVIWVVVAAVLLAALGIGLASCTRVEVGHVGILVKLAGSDRGVQNAPIVTGWVAYNPLTETVIEFPTSVQNVVWTRDVNEGHPNDESITFASSEGVTVNADIGLAFHIDPAKAPKLYTRFREADVLRLAHGYVRNVVREALSEVSSGMVVQEIYGSGKTRLVQQAQRLIEQRLSPDGFVIDQLTFVSALRLPENVVGAINLAMEATQNAIQAENRVRQTRAEAEQAVEAARGQAEAARQQARGQADSLLIRAHAEAQANEVIRLSMSPEVIAYRQLERWDGHLPVVHGGGNVPMLTLDTSQFLRTSEADRRARLRELLGAQGEPTVGTATQARGRPTPTPTPAPAPSATPRPAPSTP